MDNLCFKSSRSHVFRVLSECSVSPSLLQYHILVKTYFFLWFFSLGRDVRVRSVNGWAVKRCWPIRDEQGTPLTNKRACFRLCSSTDVCLTFALNMYVVYWEGVTEGREECSSLAAKHKLHFRLFFKQFWEIKFRVLVIRWRDGLSYCILQFL